MLQNIMVDLGGRIAEEIIFKDVTTGASQDIKQASKLARAMVTPVSYTHLVPGYTVVPGDPLQISGSL